MVDKKCFSDCCMVLSGLGTIFMFYLSVLFIFDPERMHLVNHINEEEDSHNYSTACISGLLATLIYGAIAGGLYYKNYGTKEKTEELLNDIKNYFKVEDKNLTYEQNQNFFEKAEEMSELRRSNRHVQ